MIRLTLAGDYGPNVRLHHIRMAFSKDMNEVGKFRVAKLVELVSLVFRIYAARVRFNCTVLYYPPAPPQRVPILRDFVVLLATRWLFGKTIFHMHAGGLSEAYMGLSRLMKWTFWRAYGGPDVVIRPSSFNPEDGRFLKARNDLVIPNGIEDHAGLRHRQELSEHPEILFVGVICRSKGVEVALDACRQLRERSLDVTFKFMGRFESPSYEREIWRFVEDNGLGDCVEFLGERTGNDKWSAFRRAWIFCYPSFFEAESFGLVVAEAMSFAMPVVATRWRGIQSLVVDGETGFLVPVRDAAALSERIAFLLENPDVANKFGKSGRGRYLAEYSIERYHEQMRQLFQNVLVNMERKL